jgi:hypothetical protein
VTLVYRLETFDGFGPYWYDTTKQDDETHTHLLIDHDDPYSQGLCTDDMMTVEDNLLKKWKFAWNSTQAMCDYVRYTERELMHNSPYKVSEIELSDMGETFTFRDGQIMFNPAIAKRKRRIKYLDFINLYNITKE